MKHAITKYTPRGPQIAQLKAIEDILTEYRNAGQTASTRQVYYWMADEEIFSHDKVGFQAFHRLIGRAKAGGVIDWDDVPDLGREPFIPSAWNGVNGYMRAGHQHFRMDTWTGQDRRPEIWVQRDSLVSNLLGLCREHRVVLVSSGGSGGFETNYRLYRHAQRLNKVRERGQVAVIVSLSDLGDPQSQRKAEHATEALRAFGGEHVIASVDPPKADLIVNPITCAREPESWDVATGKAGELADRVEATLLGLRSSAGLWQELLEAEAEVRASFGEMQ